MSIQVHIPDYMRPIVGNNDVIEVEGSSVGECLNHFLRQFPGIENELFDQNGKLHIYLNIFINNEYAYPDELSKPVQDGDMLYIHERSS